MFLASHVFKCRSIGRNRLTTVRLDNNVIIKIAPLVAKFGGAELRGELPSSRSVQTQLVHIGIYCACNGTLCFRNRTAFRQTLAFHCSMYISHNGTLCFRNRTAFRQTLAFHCSMYISHNGRPLCHSTTFPRQMLAFRNSRCRVSGWSSHTLQW